jgi:hypothetical protein
MCPGEHSLPTEITEALEEDPPFPRCGAGERQQVSQAMGAGRRSGERERLSGSRRGEAPRLRLELVSKPDQPAEKADRAESAESAEHAESRQTGRASASRWR